MPNANAVVDSVNSLSASPTEVREAGRARHAAPHVTVKFKGGQFGVLDMSQPRSAVWAEVLHSMREANQPAYVEIDPATNFITELLCPIVVKVGELRETNSGAEVDLIISHARHYLQRTRKNFRELLEALNSAHRQKSSVAVTETDDHQIIDVRPFTARPSDIRPKKALGKRK
jgi:hypothetical protein